MSQNKIDFEIEITALQSILDTNDENVPKEVIDIISALLTEYDNHLKYEIDDMEQEIESLNQEKCDAIENLENLEAENNTINDDNEEYSLRIMDLERQLENSENEVYSLEDDVSNLETEIESLQSQLDK